MKTSAKHASRHRLLFAALACACSASAWLLLEACGDTEGDKPRAVEAGLVDSPVAPDSTVGESDAGDGANGDGPTVIDAVDAGVPTQIVAGDIFGCALMSEGAVWCWGGGAGGLGAAPQAVTPGAQALAALPIPGLAGIKSIAATHRHVCALSQAGEVFCWGAASDGQTGVVDAGVFSDLFVMTPTKVSLTGPADQLRTGHYSTCARLVSGEVQCWGQSSDGNLGYRVAGDGGLLPYVTPFPVTMEGVSGPIEIAPIYVDTCLLWDAGTVSCVGENYAYGGLGNDAAPNILRSFLEADASYPVMFENDASAVTLGVATKWYQCAIVTGGSVQCWGANDRGQSQPAAVGTTMRTPVTIQGVTSASAISAGTHHTCVIADGDVYCWGDNQFGQVSAVEAGAPAVAVAKVVGLPAKAVAIAAGGEDEGFTCALLEGKSVHCWGSNEQHKLGRGDAGVVLGSDPTPQAVAF